MSENIEKEWTIMVYLAGDNNLSEEMITALTGMKNAMQQTNSDKHINLVAVYDSAYPTVGIRHYEFTQANAKKPLEQSQIDYIHPQKKYRRRKKTTETIYIIDFVRWASSNWKAKNYALILSGHADGPIGRTMFRDSNPSTNLNLRYLTNILNKSQKHLDNNKRFSLLGFDSCLMNMAEVGYQLKDLADVVVASQGNVPTSGWAYENILKNIIKEISSNGNLTSKKFATSIVDRFVDYSKDYNIGGRSINISACDLAEAENLSLAIYELAEIFNRILKARIKPSTRLKEKTALTNTLKKERLTSLIHKSHYNSQTFMYEQAVDIGDFVVNLYKNCELIRKEFELIFEGIPSSETAEEMNTELEKIKTQCNKTKEVVDKYVFDYGMCGSEYQFSKGVSMFFPWTLLSLYMIKNDYKNLKFSKKNKAWINFIETYSKMTFRSEKEPSFNETISYIDWSNSIASHKDVSFKDVSFKDVSFKGGGGEFYRFFKRFRNHPIKPEVNIRKPK